MGKSEKRKPRLSKSNPKVEEQEELDPPIVFLSSDDEADDDLSLKIVEKAMSRASNNSIENPSSSSLEAEVIITDLKRIKKTEEEKMEAQDTAVEDVEEEEEGGTSNVVGESLETDAVENSDSIVLRKLLRGPRYFDPPDSSWGNCYNCGEGGHTAANCTSEKRKKPCYVCGSLEHNAKQCKQGRDCFICKKGGHRAKNCPEKSVGGSLNAKICLKCGNSGHDMFSCKNVYSPDDLKEVQCYVCKCFGHLCCVNYSSARIEVSCYKCGQLGHTGLECARVHAEKTSTASPSSCYKCGEEGHMARKCKSSAKKGKRKSEFSSPKRSYPKDNGNQMKIKSVPHDLGKGRKRKNTQYGHPDSSQSKRRGGWITEDPGDRYHENYNANGWRSPTTPASYSRYHGNYGPSAHGSGYYSNGRKLHFESSASNGYQHRFSASRFGGSSSYGRREYGWDY